MLKVKNITKTYGDIKALDDVSFEVKKGEIVFLTGPSGAGKTTLIKLIIREILPDSGEIDFDGTNVVTLGDKNLPAYRQKIGVVFQDFKILPERTLRENVEVPLAVIGVDQDKWKLRVEQTLEAVGLKGRAELFPAQLSGGELQRASSARALIIDPKLILADEPTGNLDWETAKGVMDIFGKINKEGKTIVIATHNKLIVDNYNYREIKLKAGRIISSPEKTEKVSPKSSETKLKVRTEEI